MSEASDATSGQVPEDDERDLQGREDRPDPTPTSECIQDVFGIGIFWLKIVATWT